jgi:Domain of unknown function (DUF932)
MKQQTNEERKVIDVPTRFSIHNANELPFDWSKADRSWEKEYGIVSAPLNVRALDGTEYDDHKWKGIFFEDYYRTIVHRGYVVVPNAYLDKIVVDFVEKNKDLHIMPAPVSGANFRTSHHGDAAYWTILSDRFEKVIEGDDVQLGCVVRNSIGTYVALGADLFTVRQVCTNGAIAKGHDLGSIAIRHIGNHQDMLRNFGAGIERIIDKCSELVEYYRQATQIKLNKKIAEEWAKRIPQRALPENVHVDEKGKVTLSKTTQPTVWEAFNEITYAGWHGYRREAKGNVQDKTGFLTKNHLLQHAHKVLIAAVQGKYNK